MRWRSWFGWLLAVPHKNLGRHNYSFGLDADATILKWMAKNGMNNWQSYHGGTPRGLYAYAIAKLNVDPFLDRGALEKEYCDTLFGAASPWALKAVRADMAARRGSRWFVHRSSAAERVAHYREMSGYFDQALAAVKDDAPARARLLGELLVDMQSELVDLLKSKVSDAALRPAVERYAELYTQMNQSWPKELWLATWAEKNKETIKKNLDTKLASWGYSLERTETGDGSTSKVAALGKDAARDGGNERRRLAAPAGAPAQRWRHEDLGGKRASH